MVLLHRDVEGVSLFFSCFEDNNFEASPNVAKVMYLKYVAGACLLVRHACLVRNIIDYDLLTA